MRYKISLIVLLLSVIATSLYATERVRTVRRSVSNSCGHHVQAQIVEHYPQYVQEQVYYFVGQPLRIESLLRIEQKDEEYAEFKAWKAAKLRDSKPYTAKITNPDCEHCKPAVPTQPEIPPENPVATSLYAQKCSSCHSGATPKGQLTLTADTFINFEQYKKAIKHIDAGTMPKGGPPLTEAESNFIKSELLKLVQ